MRQRDIFFFWLPLCASWLLMCAEGPLLSATVNRLPNEVVMLAALGIVFSLAVTIESPIINLLATATALVKDRASFAVVRRFTVHWMVFLTAVSALLAFTPLFDWVVRRALGVPPEVAAWVRPGLQILVPWPAAIAWRRFLQGVLIHFNQTRQIAYGTAVRLSSTAGVAFGLLWLSDWPGIYVAATALDAGVLTEAVYATLAVRPLLAGQLAPGVVGEGEGLGYRRLFWFHLPLAGTSVFALLAQPLVTFALARLDQPTLSLAAWPLIFQALLVMRAPAFSLPEAVIALGRTPESRRPIRRFSLTLTVVSGVVMTLFALTPLGRLYLEGVQDTTAGVAELCRIGFVLFIPLPSLTVLIAWMRGLLIQEGKTRVVNEGMAINVALLAALLGVGLLLRWPGIPAAAVALDVSFLAQFLYLWWRVRRLLAL